MVLAGCDRQEPPTAPAPKLRRRARLRSSLPPPNPDNNAYFGDVHVHTGWSFDALTNGSKTTPTDAYAWAQGKAITGSGGPEMQIKTPLDFYMVADHAEYMGVFNQMSNPDSPISKTETRQGRDLARRQRADADLCRHPARHERGQARPAVERPGAGAHRLGRDRQGGGRQLRARQVHHLRRLRMDVESAEAQPAPRRRLPRYRAPARPGAVGARFRRSRDAVEVDGRSARQGFDAVRHSAQRQCQRRPHVRTGEVRRQADRCGLQQDARRQRTAVRDHPDQGHLGNPSRPVADRRVRRLRAVGLHAVGGLTSGRRIARAASPARRCSMA